MMIRAAKRSPYIQRQDSPHLSLRSVPRGDILKERFNMKEQFDKRILLVVDNEVLDRYTDYYFKEHPRATKRPIPYPYHESINKWMIMKRAAMNALKQKWKAFIKWFVAEQGYANLHIDKCEITQTIYYYTQRRHDIDNSVPKFILDGLVESGMLIDDDDKHITELTLRCRYDAKHPRTELLFNISK